MKYKFLIISSRFKLLIEIKMLLTQNKSIKFTEFEVHGIQIGSSLAIILFY